MASQLPAIGSEVPQGGALPPVGAEVHQDPTISAPASGGTSGGLVGALTAKLVPFVQRTIEEFATSPNVPKAAASLGRVIGGTAPIVGGAAAAGPAGALMGVGAAAKGAWAGGKTGWFTGKLAQNMSESVASAMEKAAPYAQTLGTLSGVQSGLDLAQMAEPDRHDIGVLGIGKTFDVPGMHPAVLNELASTIRNAIGKAVLRSQAGMNK